jgi:hypothetical protein
MSTARRLLLVGVLAGVPAAVWVAWLGSGRDVFTAPEKAVEVAVRDPLFGDTVEHTEMRRGPIGGYYVGLDLALAVTVAALVVGGLAWWLIGRGGRRRRAAQVERGPNT